MLSLCVWPRLPQNIVKSCGSSNLKKVIVFICAQDSKNPGSDLGEGKDVKAIAHKPRLADSLIAVENYVYQSPYRNQSKPDALIPVCDGHANLMETHEHAGEIHTIMSVTT